MVSAFREFEIPPKSPRKSQYFALGGILWGKSENPDEQGYSAIRDVIKSRPKATFCNLYELNLTLRVLVLYTSEGFSDCAVSLRVT